MHGDSWAAPTLRAPVPPPPPPPPLIAPGASLPPPPAVPTLPTLPGGPRPAGGIVPHPEDRDATLDGAVSSAEPTTEADPDRPAFTPVTRAALGPSRNHRRVRGRAAAAVLGALLAMVATIGFAAVLLQRRAALIDLRDGGAVSPERIAELDDRVAVAVWASWGAFLLGGILGVVWFRRAYKNLKSMGRNSYGQGWAIAGWIVPIMSLFRPYQMAKELVRESPRVRGNEGTGLVGIWWLVYVAGTLGSQGISRLAQDTLDDIILNDMLRVVLLGLSFVAGIAWIAIIRVVTRRQDAWFDQPPDTPSLSPNGTQPPAVR